MKIKPDAWKKLGITQAMVDACVDVANSSSSDSSERYWNKCASFLRSLKVDHYNALNQKQRNWAHGIKQDLKLDHGYTF